jgi:hypothetical protein
MRCECSLLDQDSIKELEAGSVDEGHLQAVSRPDSWLKGLLTIIGKPDTPRDEISFGWLDFVSEFSRLNLTYETDRPPALSGLAKRFERPMLGRYLAGIWEGDLALGLLYRAFCDEFHLTPTEQLPKAPSWTWASIPLHGSNYISYSHVYKLAMDIRPSDDFHVVSVPINVIGKNPFSWVSEGVLTVRGNLCNWNLMGVRDSWFLRMLAEDGTVVLARGSRSHQKGASFHSDGRITLKIGMTLSCLLVGSRHNPTYGLVLQNLHGTTYRRVGLFEHDLPNVFEKVPLAKISIV